jgi:hypothetical protein
MRPRALSYRAELGGWQLYLGAIASQMNLAGCEMDAMVTPE